MITGVAKKSPDLGQSKWNAKKGRWEKWSGKRWKVSPYSLDPERLLSSSPLEDDAPLSIARRTRLMKQVVSQEALAGARVVQQEDEFAVFARKRPVSNVLHAILFVITAGVWGIVWILASLQRTEDRYRLDIDTWGNAWVTQPR